MNWLNNNKRWLRIVAFIGLALLIIYYISVLFIDNITLHWRSSIWLVASALIFLYAIKGVAMVIPTTLLYIAAGMTLPTWVAILVTYIGLIIALTIAYTMGKKLGEEKVSAIIAKRKKLADFLYGNKENVLSICFMTHLLPTPLGFVSLFFGALNVPLFKYIFISLLGITPYMVPVVFAGAAIYNPLSAAFLVPFGISLFITLTIFIVYKTRSASKSRNAAV